MERRKNYLIKKRFQLSFLGPFVILLILESILIVSLFLYLSQDTLTTGYIDSVLRIERTQNFFFIPFLLLTLIVVLGVAITGMIIFIMLSHRLAGPVYRFEQTLKQAEGGNLDTRIHLRKNDQFGELETALNRFIGSLSRRIGSIKTDLEEARSILSRKDDPAILAKVSEKVNLMAEEIKHFKVTPQMNNELNNEG